MANKIKGLTVEVNGDTTRLKTALNQAEDVVKRYDKQLKTLNKALNEDPTNSDNISKKQEVLKKLVEETTIEIEKYRDIQNQLDAKGVEHSSAEWLDVENRIISAEASLVSYKKQMSSLSAETKAFKEHMESISDATGKLANKLAPLSTMAVSGLKAMAEQSISYESSIANIKKVVTDLTDETVEDLKEIASSTGTAFTEISDYASMAGTLGIAEKDISAFAKAMTDLNTATGGAISGEEGAKSVARFLNLVDVGTDQVSNFGSALTGVADQFATTADEVLDTSSAMAGLASIFNVSQYDIIGISAVLQSLGVSSNVSASSMTKAFQTIELAVNGGGDSLKEFADTAGMSAEEFTQAWEEKPMQVLLDFADGLQGKVFTEIQEAINSSSDSIQKFADTLGVSKDQFIQMFNEDSAGTVSKYADALGDLNEEESSAIQILDDLGLSGVRYSQTLLKLSGNGQKVKDAIEDANEAWSENTALTKKANTVYETTERKLESAKEKLKQIVAQLGDSLVPVIDDACDALGDFTKWFSNLSDGTKKTIVKVTAFTAVLSPLLKGISAVTGGISSAIDVYDELSTALSLASGGTGLFATAISGLGTALPIVGVGLAALVTGTIAVTKAMEDYKNSISYKNKEIMDSFDELKEKANETYSEQAYNIEKTNILAQDQASKISALVDVWKAQKEAGKDNSEVQEQIDTAISNLNETLGINTISFDSATGAIKNQNTEVDNLKQSIQEMIDLQKKQAWLETYAEAYDQALEYENQLLENRSTALKDYSSKQQELISSDKGLYDAYNAYINATEENKTEKQKEYQRAIENAEISSNILLTEMIQAKNTVEQTNKDYQEVAGSSATMKENFDAIDQASGEIVQNLMNTVDAGLNFDASKNDIQYIRDNIAECKAEIEASKEFGFDTTNAQEELKFWEEQLSVSLQAQTNMQNQSADETYSYSTAKAQESALGMTTAQNTASDNVLEHQNANTDASSEYAMSTADEVLEHQNENADASSEYILTTADETGKSVLDTGNTYRDMFLENLIKANNSKGSEIANSLADGYKSGVDIAHDYAMNTNFDKEATLTYYVKYTQVGQAWNGLSSVPSGSGGLSRSGGISQSGGITLNNTFNVTSNGITKSTVNSWAVQIADTVSEILGGRINV